MWPGVDVTSDAGSWPVGYAHTRSFLWRFPSAEHQEVARRFDVSEDDTLVLRLDYLKAVARKPSWL